MRDNMNNLTFRGAIAPVVVTNNTAQVGTWIDTAGHGSLTFAIQTGLLSDVDAAFAVLVEDADADDQSDAAEVPDSELLSQMPGVAPAEAAGFTANSDNATRKVGYAGFKRYVRLTITPSGNSGNAPLSAMAVLGHAHSRPTAVQPDAPAPN